MADRRPRRGSRVLLWGWALISLLLVAWTGLLYASSVPVTGAMAAHAWGESDERLRPGDRLLVEPLPSTAHVATVTDAGGRRVLGAAGDVIYFTPNGTRDASAPFPAQNPGGALSRPLAFLVRNATTGNWDAPNARAWNVTSLNVTGAPVGNATVNLTVNLSSVNGTVGFLVKQDAAAEPENALVAPEQVYGRVSRVLPPSALWQAGVLAGVGLAVPLALIIVSHRGRGVAGVPGAGATHACPECGKPADVAVDFCVRCGAMMPARP